MKIRKGLVSNSSSSSYILFLGEKIPNTKEELSKLLNLNCLLPNEKEKVLSYLDKVFWAIRRRGYSLRDDSYFLADIIRDLGSLLIRFPDKSYIVYDDFDPERKGEAEEYLKKEISLRRSLFSLSECEKAPLNRFALRDKEEVELIPLSKFSRENWKLLNGNIASLSFPDHSDGTEEGEVETIIQAMGRLIFGRIPLVHFDEH